MKEALPGFLTRERAYLAQFSDFSVEVGWLSLFTQFLSPIQIQSLAATYGNFSSFVALCLQIEWQRHSESQHNLTLSVSRKMPTNLEPVVVGQRMGVRCRGASSLVLGQPRPNLVWRCVFRFEFWKIAPFWSPDAHGWSQYSNMSSSRFLCLFAFMKKFW